MEFSMKIALMITLGAMCLLSVVQAMPKPDAIELPPEGFAFGGIPYGSMSGNVAEYYRMKEAEAAASSAHYVVQPAVQYPNYYAYNPYNAYYHH